MIGWGLGTDTYFSIYVSDIIGSAWGITAIGTVLALSKLLIVIPIGSLNDRVNVKYLLLIGKILYFICGILFFLAGLLHTWVLLLFATIFCGFASGITFTTYQSFYGKNSTKSNHTQIFGMFFSSYQVAQIIGALISVVLVRYLELPFMYMFVVIFALISILQDDTMRLLLPKYRTRSWNTFFRREIKTSMMEVESSLHQHQSFRGQHGFLDIFIHEIFSTQARKRIIALLKGASHQLYTSLGSVGLTYFLSYVGFLFIPIVALANNLNLSQIALVYAVMKVPYLIMVFLGKRIDKINKKLIIGLIFIFMSLMYVLLGFQDNFAIILVLTFGISLGIAFLNPITVGLVSDYAQNKDQGVIAGATNFTGKLGEILGSLGFGILVTFIGVQSGFILVGAALFILGLWIVSKKILVHRIQ
ncbi:hypothetical protein AGMMS50249_4840 [candidate division SR1 bacterium]|nr:hypothetical protein AGMMS50249_4840 [candidate division SR1 bacterium]